MLKKALIFLAVMASTVAMAEEDPCEAGSKQSAALCLQSRAETAESNLNESYKEVMLAIGSDQSLKALLVSAQKHWLKFRSESCKLETSFSINPEDMYLNILAGDSCAERLTLERVRTLDYYKCVLKEDVNHCTP